MGKFTNSQVSKAMLEACVGQHIRYFCANGFNKDTDNHCAHFVSHMLGMYFGATCKQMTGRGDVGANLRVHEIFAKCNSVGKWEDLPSGVNECLAFVTAAANVNLQKKQMVNVPKKHIGIYYGGSIYHYKNALRQVVKQAPDQFAKHYPGKDTALFFGTYK